MRLNRAGIVAVAFVLSACGYGAASSPSTAPSSPSQSAGTGSPAAATIAPASPSQTRSATPSELPSPPPVLGSLRIPFANREMEITIVGAPGIVLAWRAASDRDFVAIAWGGDTDIALGRLSERDLVLGWIGTVCDVKATLTVAPGRLMVTPVPRQGCDAVAVGRGMVLTFADSVDPAAITVELGGRVLLPEDS